MQIEADKYTPTDDTLIPTGKIEPVKGTPFDFTAADADRQAHQGDQGRPAGVRPELRAQRRASGNLRPCAKVTEPKSGRVMTVTTTEPGVQFYTGNFLDGKQKGKGGVRYKQYGGFCLETQHYPDSINQKDFPSVVLEPGKTYTHTTVYGFSVAK